MLTPTIPGKPKRRAARDVNDLIGFNPQYEGQTLTDFMAYRDDPLADVGAPPSSYERASAERSDSIQFGREQVPAGNRRSNFSSALPGSRVPLDVRVAAMTGGDPKRLAQWGGSTQGQTVGGVGALVDDLKMSPVDKALREVSLDNQRLRGDSLALNMANSAAAAGRAEESHEMNRKRFDLGLEQVEQRAADQLDLGNARADVLELQNPGLGTVQERQPALEHGIDFLREGKIEAADELLGMQRKPIEPVEVVDLGSGVQVLQRGDQYLGQAPRPTGAAAPTTKARNNEALMGALESGDYATAALYMPPVEEAGGEFGDTVIRRPATAADAQAYYQSLKGGSVKPVNVSSGASVEDAMNLFKQTK